MADDRRRLFRNAPWGGIFSSGSDNSSDDQTAESLTIADLIEMYGEGAVLRGLAYMESLNQADDTYRQSTDKGRYKENLVKSLVESPEEAGSDQLDNAAQKWHEQMEDNGLRLED